VTEVKSEFGSNDGQRQTVMDTSSGICVRLEGW
jgi:hypothetical protein